MNSLSPCLAYSDIKVRWRIFAHAAMRSFLPVFAVVICAVVMATAVTNPGQQQKKSTEKHQPVCNVPSTAVPCAPVLPVPDALTPITTEKQTANWQSWFWPPEWATWALVIVAIWTAIVALNTLKEIRDEVVIAGEELQHTKQFAEATIKSANAASLNAQAVINAERPWMVVATFFDEDRPELCRFGCRNQGDTPAKIVSVSAEICFIEKPDDLPVPPDYSSPVNMPDLTLIVHADSFPIGAGVNPRSVIGGTPHEVLVLTAREFIVYFGNVVYRDTLYPESSAEGLHETRWCFVYQPGGERMFLRGGPDEYNRYT
jgi:hypothetical protein